METHQDKPFQFVAVAVDAQGPAAARPFVEAAKPTFPNLVDRTNLLADLFGFKVIPNLLMIDEQGIYRGLAKDKEAALRWVTASASREGREPPSASLATVEQLQALVRTHPDDGTLQLRLGEALMLAGRPGEAEQAFAAAARLLPRSAPARFRWGGAVYAQGRKAEALRLWREALARDPNNYLIRRQVWAVEHPEQFYGQYVDYEWQKTLTRAGDRPAAIKLRGAQEAEALQASLRATEGTVEVQKVANHEWWQWSGDAFLVWRPTAPEAQLHFALHAPTAGTYEVTGYFTRGDEYGKLRLLQGDRPVSPEINLYDPFVSPTVPVVLGKVQLKAGANPLSLLVTGKDPLSKGHLIGIDAFVLKRVGQRTAR